MHVINEEEMELGAPYNQFILDYTFYHFLHMNESGDILNRLTYSPQE